VTPAVQLLTAVAAATHETRIERMLLGVADAFAHVITLERVDLDDGGGSRLCARRRSSGSWQLSRSSATKGSARKPANLVITLDEHASQLSLWCTGRVPSWLTEPELHESLARVLECGRRSRTVVQRVADLSRRAHQAQRELQRDLADGARPIARSPTMHALIDRARAVAGYPTSVLIRGESGVGKEVIANFVHALSPRSRAPFVRVNCGALPEGLAESELFGHEAGAFTGANRRHVGVFERADRGTLFLDEVGELTASLQVKLLRTLQEGELTRVGGEQVIAVDVRVIAATNRSLEDMLAAGRFREDLYFRLSVFPLDVPSLRERPEDIPALVDELLDELCQRLGRTRPRLDDSTLARLVEHRWPGNVRELANTLEAALIVSHGELQLPDSVPARSRAVPIEGTIPSFEQGTRELICRALLACQGKVYGPGGAAEQLDLHPATLQGKLRKLGISRLDFVE
jgi:transcriptional regulator with GAF, ATPase, and Fis domain